MWYDTMMASSVNAPRSRRPRGSLSRNQVVDAALALADREGLDALSMPALARRLGCGVMTVYGYVENKDDLLDALAQRALAELRLPRPMPSGAAEILRAWGRALRLALLEHPGLSAVMLTRPVIGPGIFNGAERLLGGLGRAGYPAGDGVHAIYAVLTYTVGFVAWEHPRTRRQPPSAYAARWRQVFATLPPADFPLCAGALDEFGGVAGEAQFELGLAALAAGLVARGPVPPCE